MGVGAGSKGSSESRSTTSSTTTAVDSTTNNVDNRAVQGDGAVFGGNVNLNVSPNSTLSGVSVVTSDYGAVHAGIDAAVRAVDALKEANAVSNQTTQGSIEKSLQLAANNSAAQGAETTQQFLKWGAIVAIVGLVAWGVARSKLGK